MKNTFYVILTILTICVATDGKAQSKKEQRAIYKLNDTPRLLNLDKFLPLWFQAQSCIISDNWNEFSMMKEITHDANYAYFNYTDKMRSNNYRVLLSDLERIKFGSWSVCNIKDEIFKKCVDEKDRKKEADLFICTSTPSNSLYTFTYVDKYNALQVRLHWRIYCEMIFKLVNKRYCTSYYFDNASFDQVE